MKELLSTSFTKIEYLEENDILVSRFLGNIGNEDYSSIWASMMEFSNRFKTNNIIIDQSNIGDVSFMARGKVIIKHLPAIKKEVGEDFTVAVVTSPNVANKSGMKYMAKAFKRLLSSFDINFFDQEKEAIEWIAVK